MATVKLDDSKAQSEVPKLARSSGSTRTSSREQMNVGRWSPLEHLDYKRALLLYGKDWVKIAAALQTRTPVQVRTHTQKYKLKLWAKAEREVLTQDERKIFEVLQTSRVAPASQHRNVPNVELTDNSPSDFLSMNTNLAGSFNAVASNSTCPNYQLRAVETQSDDLRSYDSITSTSTASGSATEAVCPSYPFISLPQPDLETAQQLIYSLLPSPEDLHREDDEATTQRVGKTEEAARSVEPPLEDLQNNTKRSNETNVQLKAKYACYRCNKKFATNQGLTLHARKYHERFEPWVCPYEKCEKSFVRKADLRLHIARHHLQIKPYQCLLQS